MLSPHAQRWKEHAGRSPGSRGVRLAYRCGGSTGIARRLTCFPVSPSPCLLATAPAVWAFGCYLNSLRPTSRAAVADHHEGRPEERMGIAAVLARHEDAHRFLVRAR